MQPGKLREYVEGALNGGKEDDGLLSRFSLFVFPDPEDKDWVNVDRKMNYEAFTQVCEIYKKLDAFSAIAQGAEVYQHSEIPAVHFSSEAQELFNEWRYDLENRVRSDDSLPPAMISHLTKYRKAMPAMALIFQLLDVVSGKTTKLEPSEDAAWLSIKWCKFLEQHVRKVYLAQDSAINSTAKAILTRVRDGHITDGMKWRAIQRKSWRFLQDKDLFLKSAEHLSKLHVLKIEERSRTNGGMASEVIRIHPSIIANPCAHI